MLKDIVQKQSFIIGLLTGVAVVSLVAFFITLPKALQCSGVVGTGIVDTPPTLGAQPTTPPPSDAPVGKVAAVTKDDYIRGDKNAKVTLIEYSDFECPFCSRHQDNVEKILEEYSGKVRLVYRHFPLSFHQEAQKAAEASECAGEQDKFWEMHDIIYEANAAKETMSVEKWKTAAGTLGLKQSKFDDCLDSGKYASKVKKQMAEGSSAGVKGTPATFINGKMVSGAIPYDVLKAAIDEAL